MVHITVAAQNTHDQVQVDVMCYESFAMHYSSPISFDCDNMYKIVYITGSVYMYFTLYYVHEESTTY